jgi:hypothetical protein
MNPMKPPIQRIRHGARGVRSCLGIVVAISSAACAPSPNPAHQTVEYYRANPQARQTKVAECARDPAVLGKTADCVNAKQAASLEGVGSFRDLPPMGLTPDTRQDDSSRTPDGPGSPDDRDQEREAK